MSTELALTHLCGATIHLVAGAWTTPRGRTISHCITCGEWLGSPFTRAEEVTRTPSPIGRASMSAAIPSMGQEPAP